MNTRRRATVHSGPRSLQGIAFAALLALALWLTAMQAVADTRTTFGGPNLFDPGFADHPGFAPRQLGRFGVTWE